MIRLVFERIKHRKATGIIILIAFISVFTLIPIGLEQSKTSKVIVHDSIENYGRGSYDLLVRPADSQTLIEDELGMVEENYVGDSKGGISLEEWKQLKNNPDIEIAAPVASLGYFKGKQFSLELPILDEPTRFTYQFYTSDGLTEYPLGNKESIMYFENPNPGLIQYLKSDDNENSVSAAMTMFMPENYNLLVAVDPESESKLTGIDFSELENEIKDPMMNDILHNYGNPPVIKVLQRDNLNIPVYLKLKVDQLNVNIGEVRKYLELQEDQWLMDTSPDKLVTAFQKLDKIIPENTNTLEIDLTNFNKPFDGTAVQLNEKFMPILGERFMQSFDTSTYYTASKISYDNIHDLPSVRINTPGSPPSYKLVEQKGVSMIESSEVPFMVYQVGTFSMDSEHKNKLAASPLGIYGDMSAVSENGHVLTPTTEPGSFIPSPASGITTLENAELIKGEKPIDAIRVRVAGIENYDTAAQQKIEKVATDLLHNGYEVDIVAGSSFKEMTLDVEGIGKVKESWTTLGVAQDLTDTWNVMNFITTILLSGFGILWLIIRLTFENHTLVQENEILTIIGWKKSKITWLRLSERVIVIFTAYIVSLIVLNIVHAKLYMYGVVSILFCISFVISAILLNVKGKPNKREIGYKKFASIFYYKKFFIPMIFILCLSIMLISIQIATLGDSFSSSIVTSLGQFIGQETIWFQIIVTLLVIYLSIVSFTDGLSTLFMERKQEFVMYHVIGWTKRRILKYVFKESIVWFAFSCIIGSLISGLILNQLSIQIFWIFIGIGTSIVVMSVILTIILLTRRSIKPGNKVE
ncbi:FtsX-like permease family protein [Pallidibacillus pasinlerensis]|uniref:ABC transporter permease n=1 Tax=Pallidibacillus pasinlerensis TaxID=2703818 RepID=A0ABX0A7D2_9BACI|nr:ABC transporter permease [Pallidibacillus pasinlerensis]NCU17954.1 ABC transporter permease [Pallidibacillus pasinlerensis]